MTSKDCHILITDLFERLEKLDTLSSFSLYIREIGLSEEIERFYKKYPQHNITITQDEILLLKTHGELDTKNKLNSARFVGSPLEKLLVAMLWKNGDLNKIQHVVEGILQINDNETDHSLIFRQFGNSLANSLEPIIDQHVLRAYAIRSLPEYSEKDVIKLRKKSVYKTSEKDLVNSYRKWFQNLVSLIGQSERQKCKELLDKILFIKGKSIKLDRTTANMGFAASGADE